MNAERRNSILRRSATTTCKISFANLSAAMNRIFLFGPSGIGKSSYAKLLSEKLSFLWLELDRYPASGDSIDHFNLRAEWNSFFQNGKPQALINELDRRASDGGMAGWVMTFPSFPILRSEHAKCLGNDARVVYLDGLPTWCLRDFLDREKQTGRNLGEAHWKGNNADIFRFMESNQASELLLSVYDTNGVRLSDEDVLNGLIQHN